MTIQEIANSSKIMLGSTEAIKMYIGNTLIWENTISRLPTGYEELRYISSTASGGQYIDLGCLLLANTDDIRIDIKFNFKGHGKDGNLQSTLIAQQPEVNPYPGFTMRTHAVNPPLYVELQSKWLCSTDWGSYVDSNKTRYCCMYMCPKRINYDAPTVNGGTYTYTNQIYEYSILIDQIPEALVNNFSCHLFCALNGSNQLFRFCEADLYYLKFTKGNTVVRDLIPAKRSSDNEIGLYDIQNDVFYASLGTDSFVAGV